MPTDPIERGLSPEACRAIARRVLTDSRTDVTEAQVAELAADVGQFVETFPPLTDEQVAAMGALLRPPPERRDTR